MRIRGREIYLCFLCCYVVYVSYRQEGRVDKNWVYFRTFNSSFCTLGGFVYSFKGEWPLEWKLSILLVSHWWLIRNCLLIIQNKDSECFRLVCLVGEGKIEYCFYFNHLYTNVRVPLLRPSTSPVLRLESNRLRSGTKTLPKSFCKRLQFRFTIKLEVLRSPGVCFP